MRTLFFTFILLIGTIISCTPKNYEKPDNLIGRSDMIEVLSDLYISQQGIQMYPVQNEDQTLSLAKDASDILKKHQIKYSDFEKSYQYYLMQPESFKEMLDDVKSKLYDQLSDEEKKRQKDQTNNLGVDNKNNK
ncbi:DUF4296 domain-containing protein [Empedobacter sedimenti]|uniref:DUF4296 domain-containing protein n=1 Tax=Empedobacter sedimenti TaxID=3042610 RepID=UPI0024A75257|nr:DUF4296 domain-containing protein [Empedobacter sedimenti]